MSTVFPRLTVGSAPRGCGTQGGFTNREKRYGYSVHTPAEPSHVALLKYIRGQGKFPEATGLKRACEQRTNGEIGIDEQVSKSKLQKIWPQYTPMRSRPLWINMDSCGLLLK